MEIRLLRSVASSQSPLLRLFAPRVPDHRERVPDLALLRALVTPLGAPVIYGAFPARARARDRVEARRLRRLGGSTGKEDCCDASIYGRRSRIRASPRGLSHEGLEGKTWCPCSHGFLRFVFSGFEFRITRATVTHSAPCLADTLSCPPSGPVRNAPLREAPLREAVHHLMGVWSRRFEAAPPHREDLPRRLARLCYHIFVPSLKAPRRLQSLPRSCTAIRTLRSHKSRQGTETLNPKP
jgi:hypothetical protein